MFPQRQLQIFFLFAAAGVLLGLIYTLTHWWCKGKAQRLLADAVFSLCCGGGLFALNFYCNNGRCDLYAALGALAGYLLYNKTLHTYLDKLLMGLYNTLRVSKEEGKQCLQAKKQR